MEGETLGLVFMYSKVMQTAVNAFSLERFYNVARTN